MLHFKVSDPGSMQHFVALGEIQRPSVIGSAHLAPFWATPLCAEMNPPVRSAEREVQSGVE